MTERAAKAFASGKVRTPGFSLFVAVFFMAVNLVASVVPSPGDTTPVANAQAISFTRKTIFTTASTGGSLLDNPTTLAIGPDNRLYVGQQNGKIHILTLDAARNVTAVQVINTIYNTPNKNDDGTPATGVVGRTVLGLVFDPASPATQPILYVTHSDPRIGENNSGTALAIDTYSGMITRLVGPDYDQTGKRADLVTDLPRSRENHGTNGLAWGPDGWLYFTQGGNTNNGAKSTFFSNLPERYLTAAVVRANVKSPSFQPLSARQIDRKGNELPGLFEVYATGYRNAYDLVWHSNGKLYVNDNGSNQGLGTTPGPADGCPNTQAIDPGNQLDQLHQVTLGAYGGHPNPARGECVFEDGTIYTPDLLALPNYTPPLTKFANGTSTNGIVEYRAATFGGAMVGNLISATWAGDQNLRRVVLSANGESVVSVSNLGSFSQPLDVCTDADGVIYVAEHGGDAVTLLLPNPPLVGAWTTRAALPGARAEVGTVEAGGKIYVLGGLGPSGRTNAVAVYDAVTDAWSAAAPYPGPALDHVGAASVGGKVYLLGGLTDWPGPAVNTVYEYTPGTNTWDQKASMPSARGAMGVAAINGKIYAAGGLSGGVAVKDLTAYDPATNSWSSLAAMPTARDHLTAEAVSGKLYAIGGRNKDIAAVTGANEVYNPATNSWSDLAPLPTPRGGHGSGVLAGHIQVFGGEGNTAAPSGTFPINQEFDPNTNTWRTLAPMPTARHGIDGAVSSDIIFVPGGGPTQGESSSTTHQAFTLTDFEVGGGCPEPNTDPQVTDSDDDGYKDQDELDNGTDSCSPASFPPDFDQDLLSDLNDPDDDNDGLADAQDQLYFDAANGTATSMPVMLGWNPGDPPRGGVSNSGFTGVQIANNGPRHVAQNISVGAAGGFLGIATTSGTNVGPTNSQENALQLGFDAGQTFRISSRVTQPFLGKTPSGEQAGGLFLGLDQDNYVRLVVTADTGTGTPGVQFGVETGGTFVANPTGANPSLTLPGPGNVDLFLDGDPAAKTITAYYRVDSTDPAAITKIGVLDAAAYPALASFFKTGLPAGLLATNAGTVNSLTFGFDFFQVQHTAAGPGATLTVAKAGSGAGTVTSSPAGINCGADCSETYPAGTAVTLTAAPAGGSAFAGWSGACTNASGTCSVTMDAAKTVTATFSTTGGPGGLPVRVNAGGGAYTDGGGQVWAADNGFSGGTVYSTAAAIAGTADDPLYRSERYGNFGYSYAVPNGGYTVKLKFAELYWSSAGQRVFDVAIEGQTVLDNFDIVAAAGGNNTAVDRSFAVSVADGTLNLTFTSVVDNAKVSAIEVVAGGTGAGLTVTKTGSGAGTVTSSPAGINCGADCSETYPAGTAVTLTAAPAGGSAFAGWSGACTNASGTCSVTMDAAKTVTATFSTTGGPGGLPVRVNAGGGAYTDGGGQVWAADNGFSGGTVYSTAAAIAGTADDPLYRSERYGNFGYSYAVPNGGYTVKLKFAELYWSSAGQRVFDVAIEGQTVLDNFDIVAAAGGNNTAVDRSFAVSVADGTLNLTFTSVVDNAKVSAIEVVAGGTGAGLTVTKTGSGAGTVTSSPAGINCGADCSETYPAGTAVTLTAAPAGGSAFAGWSGACTNASGTCSVTMDAAKTVTATFSTTGAGLTVTKTGSGTGTVTSNPTGINCGADCSETYPAGTAVTLTAAPAGGSAFAGWSGACTNASGTCSVTMDAAKTVTATFSTTGAGLTVTKTGSGTGTVTSNPTGINCGADCSETYPAGTAVTLTAAPAGGSAFAGWSGACTNASGTCSVTMDAAKTVTATFSTTGGPGGLPVRVNAGGGAYTDGGGQVWAADNGFSGGTVYSTAAAIAGTADDPLYRSERYGNFGYSYAVPNGGYTVKLKFAELYWSSAGQRVFDVAIEGQTVLDNFDIVAAAGGNNTAVDRSFAVSVADGTLNLTFTSVVNNAKVSAIEVVAAGPGAALTVTSGPGVSTTTGVPAKFSEAMNPAMLTTVASHWLSRALAGLGDEGDL